MSPRRLSGSSASPRSRCHSIFIPYTYSLRCADRNAPDGFNTPRTLTCWPPIVTTSSNTCLHPGMPSKFSGRLAIRCPKARTSVNAREGSRLRNSTRCFCRCLRLLLLMSAYTRESYSTVCSVEKPLHEALPGAGDKEGLRRYTELLEQEKHPKIRFD